MSLQTSLLSSLALFCKVVDNYGDIGICWRIARQLQQEHGITVTLWVDDLQSFQRLCPAVKLDLDTQIIEQVRVRNWCNQNATFDASEIADIVIEFFACDIPPNYILAMAEKMPRPVWINLEGLSAEAWVEGCHTLPSPHPSLSLTKYFFFPGFNERTGGLLFETDLEQKRQDFLSAPGEKDAFLAQFGVTTAQMPSLKVSLFCYPHAPIAALFRAWINSKMSITCLVPEGVAVSQVQAFLELPPVVGATASKGGLTLHVIPFMPQADYDKLLWSCDLNFVRGEDSFVRAQWAEKPFIWHIYPQDENLHHKKLKAFLKCYGDHAGDAKNIDGVQTLTLAWNTAPSETTFERPISTIDWEAIWLKFQTGIPESPQICLDWRHEIQRNGDFTSNLLKFADTVR